ncbi:hypothetical protein ACFE04_002144 [Oxalis oulophora]
MACMKLGSKPEVFLREGQTWVCTTGLPSDVTIEVGEMSFYFHKFPLLSRSGLIERLIEEACREDESCFVLKLNDIPGGAKSFELIAKFCYGVKIELTAYNIVSLRCAADYLQMTENYGEGNLISHTEAFLNEVFSNWADSIKALERCDEVLSYAEELHIVSRCIDSLAIKACADPSLFNWPVSGNNNSSKSLGDKELWNGISTVTKTQPTGDDWWFEDVSFLSLTLYKRLILAVESRGMRHESVAAALIYYAKRYLPPMNRQSSFNDANHVNSGSTISTPSEADQRALLEDLVALLPNKRGIISSKFLLRLLRTAMVLHASPSCKENLEKRVGAQLDQAVLAHPWITDTEREHLCRLMNCQKLSLEASTHAAQNERLPLRVIVQVLFFEQLRLRTSISGWFFVSDNAENSENSNGNLGLPKHDAEERLLSAKDMKNRVTELEKECLSMKQDLHKLVKSKSTWKNFARKFGFRQKSECCNPKQKSSTDLNEPTPTASGIKVQ